MKADRWGFRMALESTSKIQTSKLQTPYRIKVFFGENQPISHFDENKNSLRLFIFVQKQAVIYGKKTLLNNGYFINKKK